MSNEAQIQSSLVIRRGSLLYGRPRMFQADVSATKGPTPGYVLVSTEGTDIEFTELTTPGLVRIQNVDTTNYVEYGIFDPQTNVFYPLGELLPGEEYVLRFSRNLQEEYVGTGTGTSAPTNTFRMKANGAPCGVQIDAFEK